MHRLRLALFSVGSAFLFAACDLGQILRDSGADGLTGLTDSEIVSGLKESLVLGSKTAALDLGQVNGYLGNELVKIALPDTVEKVFAEVDRLENELQLASVRLNNLSNGTLGKQNATVVAMQQQKIALALNLTSLIKPYKDSLVTAVNRGAEKAAPNSVNVFKDAIFGMSFSDARGLLASKDTIAVTGFLKGLTYEGLNVSFKPILKEPLDLLNPNQYWKPVATGFNSFLNEYNSLRAEVNALSNITGKSLAASSYNSALPTDLSDYLATYGTGKALDGLFYMVGVQESKLRADPWAALSAVGDLVSDTVSDLIGKVFSEAGS